MQFIGIVNGLLTDLSIEMRLALRSKRSCSVCGSNLPPFSFDELLPQRVRGAFIDCCDKAYACACS